MPGRTPPFFITSTKGTPVTHRKKNHEFASSLHVFAFDMDPGMSTCSCLLVEGFLKQDDTTEAFNTTRSSE